MNFPILSTIIFLPLLGALFIFISNKKNESSSAIYISIFTSMANLLLTFFLWYSFDKSFAGFQFIEEKNWISGLIKFKLGIDGISILFIVLTAFITPICIISCIISVKKRLNEFLIAILILETFMIGVFCSLDLIIFYLFFEAGLIPMFLIIGIWPVLMGVTMYLQQKLNPAPPDPIQAKIFAFFPLFITILLAQFAAGLVIYWTTNNILSIIQQWIITRRTKIKTN